MHEPRLTPPCVNTCMRAPSEHGGFPEGFLEEATEKTGVSRSGEQAKGSGRAQASRGARLWRAGSVPWESGGRRGKEGG